MDEMMNRHPSENRWTERRYLLCENENGQPRSTLFHALLHVIGSNEIHPTYWTSHSAYEFNGTDRLGEYDRMHLHLVNTSRWFLRLHYVCLVRWHQTVEDDGVCIHFAQQLLLMAYRYHINSNDMSGRRYNSARILTRTSPSFDSICRGPNEQLLAAICQWQLSSSDLKAASVSEQTRLITMTRRTWLSKSCLDV